MDFYSILMSYIPCFCSSWISDFFLIFSWFFPDFFPIFFLIFFWFFPDFFPIFSEFFLNLKVLWFETQQVGPSAVMTSPVMKRAGTGLEMVSGTAALLATAPFVQATTPAKLTPFMVDYATAGAFGEPGSAVTVLGSASATPKKVFVNCVNDGGTQRLGGTTAVASVVVCTNSTALAVELFWNSIFIALIVNRIIIVAKHFFTSIQKLSWIFKHEILVNFASFQNCTRQRSEDI